MRKPDATITLDLPPESSKPNASNAGAWYLRSEPAKRYSKANGEVVWGHAQELGRPRWSRVVIRLTFVMPALRLRGSDRKSDPDNLIAWAKRSIDLLAKHGIINDDREVIYLPPVQRRANKPIMGFEQSRPGLTIEIWQRRDGECPMCQRQLTQDTCAG